MTDRRQFLTIVGVTLGLAPALMWLDRVYGFAAPAATTTRFPVGRTDAEWRATLTPAAYRVLRRGDTEWAFSSALNGEKRSGVYSCAGCGHLLFSSASKFESGTGWPSFWAALEGAVGTSLDRGLLMIRTEVHCAQCGGHLGHVFPDGPEPTGQRYCMNGVAMAFTPDASSLG